MFLCQNLQRSRDLRLFKKASTFKNHFPSPPNCTWISPSDQSSKSKTYISRRISLKQHLNFNQSVVGCMHFCYQPYLWVLVLSEKLNNHTLNEGKLTLFSFSLHHILFLNYSTYGMLGMLWNNWDISNLFHKKHPKL